jgi:hypothetical protein
MDLDSKRDFEFEEGREFENIYLKKKKSHERVLPSRIFGVWDFWIFGCLDVWIFVQEWVQVVPGGQEEPSHSQAAAAKKNLGEAIHSQEFKLVDPEHAPDF